MSLRFTVSIVLAFSMLALATGPVAAFEWDPKEKYREFMGYAQDYEEEADQLDEKARRSPPHLADKYHRIADLKREMAEQKKRMAKGFLNGREDDIENAERIYKALREEEQDVWTHGTRLHPPPPPHAKGRKGRSKIVRMPPPRHRRPPPRRSQEPPAEDVPQLSPSAPPRKAVEPDFPETPVEVAFRQAPVQPDDIAVVIGNAHYSQRPNGIPDVRPAYADAEGMKRFVTKALGIREGNVLMVRDASQADLVSLFGNPTNPRGRLYDWVRPGRSNVFVFYSGHGAPAGPEGQGHLVPVDANPATLDLNGYPMDVLLSNLGRIRARSVIVVLEACFSGASQRGSVISMASPVFLRPKAPNVPKGVTVISAGAGGQIASWEKDGSHGLFTKYFLKGMGGEADTRPHGNGDGWVSWGELDSYLNDTLTYLARRYYGRDQNAQVVVGTGQ